MAKFSILRIAENGEGRLLRVTEISEDPDNLLAGKRAWIWLVTDTNPKTKKVWGVSDTFNLPDGSYKYVTIQVDTPDGETIDSLEIVMA